MACDHGEYFTVITESELVFGIDKAILSFHLDSAETELDPNGVRLYAEKKLDGMNRSYAELTFSSSERGAEVTVRAMHDLSFALNIADGALLSASERSKDGSTFSLRAERDGKTLSLFFYGDCRYENGRAVLRRGESRIVLPCRASKIRRRERGFEKEAQKCLDILAGNGGLSSNNELFPMLLLVWGLKNAVFDPKRAKKAEEILPSLGEEKAKTALAVLNKYYRAFGAEREKR